MDKATDHLNDVNVKLKDTLQVTRRVKFSMKEARIWLLTFSQLCDKTTLQKAGGATNIIVKLILLILICAIGAYIYKMFA